MKISINKRPDIGLYRKIHYTRSSNQYRQFKEAITRKGRGSKYLQKTLHLKSHKILNLRIARCLNRTYRHLSIYRK